MRTGRASPWSRRAGSSPKGISVPVEGQLGSVIEPVAVVISSPSQCPDGLVEVLEDLSPVLEGPSFVLTNPSLLFPFSFPSPSPIFTFVSPSAGNDATGNTSGQGANDANASYDQRHPKGCAVHASMMEASAADSVEAGHIGGTPARE